ncbi:Glutathione S-transferase 2 [Steccherinum ochraceum]|uniref:glutathione transferase n=1 Tax=Steccherinum ochraceum TaxID=92696 RepID=A0A4R0RRW6_9APHY|nr:Glutathione S-transferase 2 [Steccherinum ochraceum]
MSFAEKTGLEFDDALWNLSQHARGLYSTIVISEEYGEAVTITAAHSLAHLQLSNMTQKHFTLYMHQAGPNSWKVAFVLNELGLEYERKYISLAAEEQKTPEYLKINPNGRLPALVDHENDDYTVWESAAILLYIVDKYDKESKLSFPADHPERHHLYQWLFFQMSGQGPYMGQAFWFIRSHPEHIPSAIERYKNEIKRVVGVLESVLSKQEWLVGEKLTIADISFVPRNAALGYLFGEDFDFEKEFPATFKWHAKLVALPGIKAALEEQSKAMTLMNKQ